MTTGDPDAQLYARALVETDPTLARSELVTRLQLFGVPDDPDARRKLAGLNLDDLVGQLHWKPGYVPSEGDLDLNRERLEIERNIALALLDELA